ncbi:MAG: helicase RepA family protein, partial [Gemmataceae bacterium]|nr:helicase RepA family protein [Gemmataceae bacterium]
MVAQHFRTGAWGRNLGANVITSADWIWPGYFAQGRVTMLTSLWKSGKTTLMSLLLTRRGRADASCVGYDPTSQPAAADASCVGHSPVADAASVGAQLAGRPVQPGQSIVLSEEDESIWAERSKRLDLGNVFFYCQPFDGKPTQAAWCAFLQNLIDKKPADSANFLVVDTLASFLPGRNENNAAVMMEALAPLRLLTRHGFAVALLHHPKKGDPLPGQAARGSGALSGFVDIFLEMSQPRGDADSRRRIVRGYSRFQETPRQLLLELNDAGDDYLV